MAGSGRVEIEICTSARADRTDQLLRGPNRARRIGPCRSSTRRQPPIPSDVLFDPAQTLEPDAKAGDRGILPGSENPCPGNPWDCSGLLLVARRVGARGRVSAPNVSDGRAKGIGDSTQ
jgi:hypothetical protein